MPGDAVILLMVSGVSPVFVTVTFWGSPVVPTNCPGKVTLLGERLATGPMPVPVSEIVCGLFAALSTIEIAAVRAPRAVGVKVALMWQVALIASELPQLWLGLKLKSPLSAPVSEMLVMANA